MSSEYLIRHFSHIKINANSRFEPRATVEEPKIVVHQAGNAPIAGGAVSSAVAADSSMAQPEGRKEEIKVDKEGKKEEVISISKEENGKEEQQTAKEQQQVTKEENSKDQEIVKEEDSKGVKEKEGRIAKEEQQINKEQHHIAKEEQITKEEDHIIKEEQQIGTEQYHIVKEEQQINKDQITKDSSEGAAKEAYQPVLSQKYRALPIFHKIEITNTGYLSCIAKLIVKPKADSEPNFYAPITRCKCRVTAFSTTVLNLQAIDPNLPIGEYDIRLELRDANGGPIPESVDPSVRKDPVPPPINVPQPPANVRHEPESMGNF